MIKIRLISTQNRSESNQTLPFLVLSKASVCNIVTFTGIIYLVVPNLKLQRRIWTWGHRCTENNSQYHQHTCLPTTPLIKTTPLHLFPRCTKAADLWDSTCEVSILCIVTLLGTLWFSHDFHAHYGPRFSDSANSQTYQSLTTPGFAVERQMPKRKRPRWYKKWPMVAEWHRSEHSKVGFHKVRSNLARSPATTKGNTTRNKSHVKMWRK